jgi:tRNA 2-thiouridine synthesizing protein E
MQHILPPDPAEWVKETEARARAQGFALTPDHWEVIHFLKEQCDADEAAKAHLLAMALEERFAGRGGRKYLLELFPKGPVAQGCDIAGLPVPVYAKSDSFGAVM